MKQRAISPPLVTLLLLVLAAYTNASEYEKVTQDTITVRCNTVNTSFLPKASLQRYQVEAERETGLLSCTVQRPTDAGGVENIRADVQARVENFYGVTTDVNMRQISVSDERYDVSYIGTYDIPYDNVMTFTIKVSAAQLDRPVTVEFKDQQPRR